MMNECGADAISVDQKNHLDEARKKLGNQAVLLGNFDPYDTLCVADVAGVEGVIRRCIEMGADAVWPGCDIWPAVKEENLKAYVDSVVKFGKGATPAVGRIAGVG